VDDEFAPLADKIQPLSKTSRSRTALCASSSTPTTTAITPAEIRTSHLRLHDHRQDNVRKRLESGGVAGNGGSSKWKPNPPKKAALPIITFEHDVTVHLTARHPRSHFPAGHTDVTPSSFFPKNNVVHMGDDFVRYGFLHDVSAGGSVQA